MAKINAKADGVKTVDELNGWITAEKAAEILGVKGSSMSYLAYSGKVNAVRIAGVILAEKTSVEEYKKVMTMREYANARKRADREQSEQSKRQGKELFAKVQKLMETDPEKAQALIDQLLGDTAK